MQRSLVELLGIKIEPTYNFSFIYIRQLAIHLRTAITVQKKDQKKVRISFAYFYAGQGAALMLP